MIQGEAVAFLLADHQQNMFLLSVVTHLSQLLDWVVVAKARARTMQAPLSPSFIGN